MKIKPININSIGQLIKKYRQTVTIQSVGLFVAVIIATSWIWGSIITLQKNYKYQRQVDANNQLIELQKLRNKTYKYQQAYYKSDEFLELSARAKLGKAFPGEHLVLLPSSENIVDSVDVRSAPSTPSAAESTFMRWIRFLFNSH